MNLKKENPLNLGFTHSVWPGAVGLTAKEINHHVHILGASGYGKTVMLTKIMKHQIGQGQGCLWLDMKCDAREAEKMISFIKERGLFEKLKVFQLDAGAVCYNMLARGSALEMRDKIISSFTWSESFYKLEASRVLLKLLVVLTHLRESQGLEINFQVIFRSLTESDYFYLLASAVTDPKIKKQFEEVYDTVRDPRSRQSLQGLLAQIESLLLSGFGERLVSSENQIDLLRATRQSEIIFIFLDSRKYLESARALARLIVRDLIATAAEIDSHVPEAQRKPFSIFIDEFSDIAHSDFTSFIDRARSSKLSLVLSHQDLADLRSVSPEFQARLTANMATTICFLQSNPDSAELIAKRIGTQSTTKITERQQGFFGGAFRYGKGEYSVREVEEYQVHPNKIKRLTVGECIVIKKYPTSEAHIIRVPFDSD